MTTSLALFGNKVLRSAIERNLVSFPAQVPAFAKHQIGRTAGPYSATLLRRGMDDSGNRHALHMSSEKVRKSLTEWRVRAISSGYIQEIGPDILPALAGTTLDDSDDEGTESLRSLKVVPIPTVAQPEAIAAGSMSALHMVLEEIGQEGLCRWAPYCVRLLRDSEAGVHRVRAGPFDGANGANTGGGGERSRTGERPGARPASSHRR